MQKVGLIILDGWGYGKKDSSDAIFNANTPFFDTLIKNYPNASLQTFGAAVGLPEGQMGNSEVGHLNIGAGRIVYQDLAKISLALENGAIDKEPVWQQLKSKVAGKTLHILGLCSDGGVHSHIKHIAELAKRAEEAGAENIYIHAFTDGRDCDPNSGKGLLINLEKDLAKNKAKIATIIGRYYAMDRDLRWERVQKAYNLLCMGEGTEFKSVEEVFASNYDKDITDEFLEAAILDRAATIKDGDLVLCANFRTDRCREISRALSQEDFPEFGMKKLDIDYYTLTKYDESFKNVGIIFNKDNIKMAMGEYLSTQGKTQLRMAETEKYPHVTFFFNGGQEQPWSGETREVVASPKVATYDLQPEMSAPELAEKACSQLDHLQPDFLCLNFANPDMVGHTGVYSAIVKAVETTDQCLQKVVEKGLELGYEFVVIADHGNADVAVNPDGSPNTAHSVNPVPIIVVSDRIKAVRNGKLGDISPTILSMMNLSQPVEMTGEVLV